MKDVVRTHSKIYNKEQKRKKFRSKGLTSYCEEQWGWEIRWKNWRLYYDLYYIFISPRHTKGKMSFKWSLKEIHTYPCKSQRAKKTVIKGFLPLYWYKFHKFWIWPSKTPPQIRENRRWVNTWASTNWTPCTPLEVNKNQAYCFLSVWGLSHGGEPKKCSQHSGISAKQRETEPLGRCLSADIKMLNKNIFNKITEYVQWQNSTSV